MTERGLRSGTVTCDDRRVCLCGRLLGGCVVSGGLSWA